jgi:hypothetical protein
MMVQVVRDGMTQDGRLVGMSEGWDECDGLPGSCRIALWERGRETSGMYACVDDDDWLFAAYGFGTNVHIMTGFVGY